MAFDGNVIFIAIQLAIANLHNLSSNRFSRNNLDRVSFATLAIFFRITDIACSRRSVESRKVSCECDIALEQYCRRLCIRMHTAHIITMNMCNYMLQHYKYIILQYLLIFMNFKVIPTLTKQQLATYLDY